MNKNIDLPGFGKHWTKLKSNQGWKNTNDNTIWKKDKLPGDHWTLWIELARKLKKSEQFTPNFLK